MSNAEPTIVTKTNQAFKEPPFYKVIFLNDNQTTVEFVIETLITFFNYSIETATGITQDIHEQGAAVVAVMPYELAEQKGMEVTMFARNQNYPLQVKLEPES